MILVLKKGCKVVVIDTERIDNSNLSSANKTDLLQDYIVVGVVDESDIPIVSK